MTREEDAMFVMMKVSVAQLILRHAMKKRGKGMDEIDFIRPKKIIGRLISVGVLDKIRAEIEHIGGDDEKAFCKNLNESYKQGLKDALKVIDKYRKVNKE